MSKPRLRVVVLTDAFSIYAPMLLSHLAESEEIDVVAIACTGTSTRRSTLRLALKTVTVARRSGPRYALGRAIASLRDRPPPLEAAADRLSAEVCAIESANTDIFRDQLARWHPDVGVSVFYPEILDEATFSIPRLGTLNLHPALLPAYAGTNPIYWTLVNGESETGVTIHVMAPRVDAGQIVAQESLPIPPDATLSSLYREVAHHSGETLRRVLVDISRSGTVPSRPQRGERSYYGRPTRDSYRQFLRRGRRLV